MATLYLLQNFRKKLRELYELSETLLVTFFLLLVFLSGYRDSEETQYGVGLSSTMLITTHRSYLFLGKVLSYLVVIVIKVLVNSVCFGCISRR